MNFWNIINPSLYKSFGFIEVDLYLSNIRSGEFQIDSQVIASVIIGVGIKPIRNSKIADDEISAEDIISLLKNDKESCQKFLDYNSTDGNEQNCWKKHTTNIFTDAGITFLGVSILFTSPNSLTTSLPTTIFDKSSVTTSDKIIELDRTTAYTDGSIELITEVSNKISIQTEIITDASNEITAEHSTRIVKGKTDVTSTQAFTTGADTIFETTITKIFAQWGDWNEWSGWNPTCYDVSADSIYKDSSKYYPKRSRTRDCIRTENGINITIAVNNDGKNCPFEDKLERERDKNYVMGRFQIFTFYVILIHN